MRRYEAYPTIRSRTGLPGVPRVALLGGALAIAALALFMLPALLGIGGGRSTGSPSPGDSGPVVTPVPTITPVPLPTQQTYVIKKGDTLSKVANAFGITLAELLAANPAIKNPNVVALGQQIVIPTPSGGAVSPSTSPTPS
jgi:LysM repeat protein